MKTIVLTNKKDLDIYMNPQRQRLLREMRLAGDPVTPKQLSVRMGISASSVQHHIAKLVDLGVIELHHTANIRGITARYYIHSEAVVSFGIRQDGEVMLEERAVHVQKLLSDISQNFFSAYHHLKDVPGLLDQKRLGDILFGIVYLTPEEGSQLLEVIQDFVQSRDLKQKPEQQAWEYALVAYNAEEAEHERKKQPD